LTAPSFKLGVRQKLALWLALALIPVVIASAAALHTIDVRLSERIETALANTCRLEARRITEALDDYRRDLESLAAGRHVVDFTAAVHGYRNGTLPGSTTIGGHDGFDRIDPVSIEPLQPLVEQLASKASSTGSEVVELEITDTSGASLGSTAGFDWRPYDSTLLTRAMGGRETLFGNAFRSAGGEDRLGMVTPILDRDGRTVGALAIEARLEPIVGLVVEHEGLGETSEAHIAQPTPGGDAQFITRLRFARDAAFDKVVTKETDLPINWALESPDGRLVRSPDYRGIDAVLAFETLPETGWGLVVKIDAEEAFRPITEVSRIIMAAAAALAFAIILGWMLFLRPLGRRMQRLAEAAERVAGGELHTEIADRSVDEIGDTARSIDKLAKELIEDIRKRARAEAQLRYQAHHDELTGLFNRKRGNELIAMLDSEGIRALDRAVLFLDLNGFKRVNDNHGHSVGDEILAVVARRLKGVVGRNSVLIRWGGDEFVIVAVGPDAKRVEELLTRLEELFARPIALGSDEHALGCSIGLGRAAGGERFSDDLLAEADARMYDRKKSVSTSSSSSPGPRVA